MGSARAEREGITPLHPGRDVFRGRDLLDPRDLRLSLATLSDRQTGLPTKLNLLNDLSGLLLQGEHEPINEDLMGPFLLKSVEIKNSDAPIELKKAIEGVLTPAVLDRVAEESASSRWQRENTEAALNAYAEFMTLEKLWGADEASYTLQTIAKKLVYSQVAEEQLEKSSRAVTSEGRGGVIYLGSLGAQMAQVVAQQALFDTCAEIGVSPVISPYYRDNALSSNLTGDDDSRGNLMDFKESLAELVRVDGSPRGRSGAKELPIKFKINKRGEISLFPGVAQVGGNVLAFSGFMDQQRLRAIQEKEVVYPDPQQRADGYRNIRVKNTHVGLLSVGDGAMPRVIQALELQMMGQLPVINFIQNNRVSIGAQEEDFTAQPELWKKGHGKDVPGIRINATDYEKMYLAIRYATIRAAQDGGPIIIEAMTERLQPHSSTHGDHLTAEYIARVQSTVADIYHAEDLGSDAIPVNVRKFLKESLIRAPASDNRKRFRGRLVELVTKEPLDLELRTKLKEIIEEIKDPAEETIKDLIVRGFVTSEQQAQWLEEASDEITKQVAEVMKGDRPDPEEATKYVRMPYILKNRGNHPQGEYELMTRQAIDKALINARRINPNVLVMGTDVYKGRLVEGGKVVPTGGYWRQEEGYAQEFMKYPRALTNTLIDEPAVMEYGLGMATTTTDYESLMKSLSVLYDGQYSDYTIQGKAAFHVLSNAPYTTSGQVTRRFGLLAPSGAISGGGLMHAHELVSDFYQTPPNVDIFYGTDPEAVYKGLLWNLLNNPNPYVFMLDKSTMEQKQKFVVGSKLLEPGHGRILSEGSRLQFVGYGAGVNTVRAALRELEKEDKVSGIGLFDIYSIRPFPVRDLAVFLEGGQGPIVIAHQEPVADYSDDEQLEPTSKAFGTQVYELLNRHPDLRALIGGREILHIGSRPVTGPPCDKILLDEVILTPKKVRQTVIDALYPSQGQKLSDMVIFI